MDRCWIRIDQVHRSFHCSESEFELILNKARSAKPVSNLEMDRDASPANAPDSASTDENKLIEAINAELAELAILSRQQRSAVNSQSTAESKIEFMKRGETLALLHASTLKIFDSP